MSLQRSTKPPKPRKCPIDGVMFTPRRPIQPTCATFACESAYAERKARKKIAREKYIASLEQQHKAGLTKPYPVLMDNAQAAFNTFVRLLDAFQPCISCGAINPPARGYSAWDAGHYRSRGACPELRFEVRNCHRQCKSCNGHDHRSSRVGTVREGYQAGIVARFGQPVLDWLDGPHEPKRYRPEDLIAVKKYWQRAAVLLRRVRKEAALKGQSPAPWGRDADAGVDSFLAAAGAV